MRTKQLWSYFNVPAKANLVWSRITFSRLTTIYFALACIHCAIQVIFQIHAFSINAAVFNSLWSRIVSGNHTKENDGFAVLGNDLRICWSVPSTINVDSCEVIWRDPNNSGPSYGLAAASLASLNPVSTTAMNAVATFAATPTTFITPTPSSSSSVTPSSSSISVVSPSSIPANTASTRASSSVSASTATAAKTATVLVKGPNGGGATTIVITGHNDHEDDEDDDDDDDDSHHNDKRSLWDKRADADKLDDTCIKALIWPVQRFGDTKREDITFIGFQFWVLGMSIVALLNESIPHIIAALVTHLLGTIWAIYQLFETERVRQQFSRLITNGACKSHNLVGTYWNQRRNAEIPSAVLNGVALISSAFLTFKLVKIYGWQTFKRVGASLTINRIYRLVLSLSISIQLALFFIVSAMALWIDQLYNGNIGRLATEGKVYKIVFIIVFCLLIPWLSLGWFAVRRENRKMSLAFLILSLIFIGLWAAMFDSKTFRWTFVTWDFFTVMAVTSGLLMISTFILALVCRFNFGKGLPHYLNAEEPLDGGDFAPVYPDKLNFGEDDPEKVDFPSTGRPVPTFSATFGRGPEVPKPTQMRFGPTRAPGTGIYGQDQPAHGIERSVSSTSSRSGTSETALTRHDTQASHKSSSSTSSGRSDGMGRRWVIE